MGMGREGGGASLTDLHHASSQWSQYCRSEEGTNENWRRTFQRGGVTDISVKRPASALERRRKSRDKEHREALERRRRKLVSDLEKIGVGDLSVLDTRRSESSTASCKSSAAFLAHRPTLVQSNTRVTKVNYELPQSPRFSKNAGHHAWVERARQGRGGETAAAGNPKAAKQRSRATPVSMTHSDFQGFSKAAVTCSEHLKVRKAPGNTYKTGRRCYVAKEVDAVPKKNKGGMSLSAWNDFVVHSSGIMPRSGATVLN